MNNFFTPSLYVFKYIKNLEEKDLVGLTQTKQLHQAYEFLGKAQCTYLSECYWSQTAGADKIEQNLTRIITRRNSLIGTIHQFLRSWDPFGVFSSLCFPWEAVLEVWDKTVEGLTYAQVTSASIAYK